MRTSVASAADYAIITRIAVRRYGSRFQSGEWMEYREHLFRETAAASLNAQTDHRFTSVLVFDRDVQESWVRRFVRHLHVPHAVVRTADDWRADVTAHLRAHHRPPLISTGLDSDDALAIDFVDRVREAIRPDRGLVFMDGVQWDVATGCLVETRKLANPFASLFSSSGAWVFGATGHKKLSTQVDVEDVESEPMWAQVIHEGNVLNQLDHHKRLVGRAVWAARFPFLPKPPLIPFCHARRLVGRATQVFQRT